MADAEETPVYLKSCTEDLLVPMYNMEKQLAKYTLQEIKSAMEKYRWSKGDVLLCIFSKCGTHLVWEIAHMLLNGQSEYMSIPKEMLMIDLIPITIGTADVPSPKAINSHYRLDLLPKQFQNRKTIFVIRNVKDYFVSDYFHLAGYWKMIKARDPTYTYPTMEEFIDSILDDERKGNIGTNSYFEFHEHMLKRRNDENILFLVFEQMVREPLDQVRKINQFLGTEASDGLLMDISDAVRFDKMKAAKAPTERIAEGHLITEEVEKTIEKKERFSMFRRGLIGGWKDYITCAQNERIESYVKKWITKNAFENIPFIYL